MKSYKTALGNLFIVLHEEGDVQYGMKYNHTGYGVGVAYRAGQPLDPGSEDVLVTDPRQWINYIYLGADHVFFCENKPREEDGRIFTIGQVYCARRRDSRRGKDYGIGTLCTRNDADVVNWHPDDLEVVANVLE